MKYQKVTLLLRVENKNKYVRGRKRAREKIEMVILSQYNMKKSFDRATSDDWEYELLIPYETDEDLDKTIYDMIDEMSRTANRRNCFIEYDVRAVDSDRSW